MFWADWPGSGSAGGLVAGYPTGAHTGNHSYARYLNSDYTVPVHTIK